MEFPIVFHVSSRICMANSQRDEDDNAQWSKRPLLLSTKYLLASLQNSEHLLKQTFRNGRSKYIVFYF